MPAERLHLPGERALWIGNVMLGMFFLPVLVLCLSLLLKLGEAGWLLAEVSLFLPMFIAMRTQPGRCLWLVPLLLLAAALGVNGLIFDTAYDGMTYHLGAVINISRGIYNPFYAPLSAAYDLWINCYPKATWYFASVVAHATHNYELGKCYNLLLACASGFYAFAFFARRDLPRVQCWLLAACCSASPVAVSQIFCYYADGALTSCITLALLASANLVREPRREDRQVFVMAGTLLIGFKFSAFAYLAVICGASLVILYRHAWPMFSARLRDVCVLALLSLIIGFNPYVTNFLSYGHPMHPLMGRDKIDVVSSNSPKSFTDPAMTRFEKLGYSLFGPTLNGAEMNVGKPNLKIPFLIYPAEFNTQQGIDIRMAGWGMWMGGIMLVSLLAYLLSYGWRERELSWLVLVTLATIFINPHAWWARYAPQVALVPVLLLAAAAKRQPFASWAVAPLYLLNSVALFAPMFMEYRYETAQIHRQLREISDRCGPGDYQVVGPREFNYDEFTELYGIHIRMRPDVPETTTPVKGMMPFRDVFLYKPGCKPE